MNDMFVGVDGCKAGWFVVTIQRNGQWEINVLPNISVIWSKYKDASTILIDIPIGLRDEGVDERLCDKQARNLLNKRKSSVFPVPCRGAVYAKDYYTANRINKEKCTKGISKQVWGIIPKIKEIDEFIITNSNNPVKIKEVHPEICFWALNNGIEMDYSKKKHKGFSERKALLQHIYSETEAIVEKALMNYKRKDVEKDDILDAIAVAITAYKGQDQVITIPDEPESDSRGLRMEMFYHSISK